VVRLSSAGLSCSMSVIDIIGTLETPRRAVRNHVFLEHHRMRDAKEASEFAATVAWWQKWEIVPGVITQGGHDVSRTMALAQVPPRLEGKRVLDIGGWNGCFSFECERRGAEEVIMLEPTPVAATHFDRIKSFLGSKVEQLPGTVYDLDPVQLGYFDIVLFFGVVYHLRYPLLAIDNIRRVCRELLFTERAVLDEAALDAQGFHRAADSISVQMNKTPLLQFAKGSEYFNDATNWFIPNHVGLNAMLQAGGFTVEHSVVTTRYYSMSHVTPGDPPFFSCAHEGIDYDLHVRRLFGPKELWARPKTP